jgi:hypothetical protein
MARKDSKDTPGHHQEDISHLPEDGTAADPVIANATSPGYITHPTYPEFSNTEYRNASVTSPYNIQGSTILRELTNDSVPVPLMTSPGSIHAGTPLTHREAYLVHHFATHLGYWLDCTDASRQFQTVLCNKLGEY